MAEFLPHAPRALHWVHKIGNLKASLDFYEKVLGLRVLRHEEFTSGCEATCNGPYGWAWCKTMIGYGPEISSFALELTFNYGISGYAAGNDLQFIALHSAFALDRAKAFGYSVVGDTILGPDNYKYKIIPQIAGRQELFVGVAIRVSNLEKSFNYWSGLLGLQEYPAPAGFESSQKSKVLAYSNQDTFLQLIEFDDGESVDHALCSGRLAFACKSAKEKYDIVTAANGVVLTPPLTLTTPGKADVTVTILSDPDGYEICFVEDIGFYELARPTFDVLDYSINGAVKEVSRGRGDHESTIAEVKIIDDLDALVEIISKETKTVIVDFGASWCKNCKRISPDVKSLAITYGSTVQILDVDIDDCEDIALEYKVSSIPRFIAFKDGHKIDDYTGSNSEELATFFQKNSH